MHYWYLEKLAFQLVLEIIKIYPSTIGCFSPTVGYVTLAPIHIPYSDPQSVVFL